MNSFSVLRLVLVASLLTLNGIADAQGAWPERPIQMIVPFPAGGGVDVVARPFAQIFGELLHQAIVVAPRDGAAGTIGTGVVAAAKPDGYTLAFSANGPVTVQPHVIPTLAYGVDSLIPLCQVFAVQYVLAVRADSKYKTLGEFIAAAKAQPGKLTYGFGGIATAPHLAISQLSIVGKIDMLGVPFRGDPQAIVALTAGEIDAAMLNVGGARTQGFRPLATFGETRLAEYPETPTVKELGYPVVSSAFGGLFGPKGLSVDIVKKIDSACEKVVADERFRKAAQQSNQEAIYHNSADFSRMIAADYAIKGDVVKRAGIKGP